MRKRSKNQDISVHAIAGSRVVLLGLSTHFPDEAWPEAELRTLAETLGVEGRVEFRGRVDEDELRELYARCGVVFYAPFDEKNYEFCFACHERDIRVIVDGVARIFFPGAPVQEAAVSASAQAE